MTEEKPTLAKLIKYAGFKEIDIRVKLGYKYALCFADGKPYTYCRNIQTLENIKLSPDTKDMLTIIKL